MLGKWRAQSQNFLQVGTVLDLQHQNKNDKDAVMKMTFSMIRILVPTMILGMISLAGSSRAAQPPQAGDPAPAFTAQASNGSTVHLKDALAKGSVILYFYPKDGTPGCTREACKFRDDYEKFQKLGATIYGVSNDSLDSHKAFIERHKLPFLLLVDTNKKIQSAYGSEFPKRHTFVIGKDGKIAYADLNVNKNIAGHSSELQDMLVKLK